MDGDEKRVRRTTDHLKSLWEEATARPTKDADIHYMGLNSDMHFSPFSGKTGLIMMNRRFEGEICFLFCAILLL